MNSILSEQVVFSSCKEQPSHYQTFSAQHMILEFKTGCPRRNLLPFSITAGETSRLIILGEI